MPLHRSVSILSGSLLICGCTAQTPPPPSVHPDSRMEATQRWGQISARVANAHRLIEVRVARGDYTAAAGAGLKRRIDDVQREAARAAGSTGGLDADTQRALNERLSSILADAPR